MKFRMTTLLSALTLLFGCGGGLRGTGARMVEPGLEEKLSSSEQALDLSWFKWQRSNCDVASLDNELRLAVNSEFGPASRAPGDRCHFYLPSQTTSARALISSRRKMSGSYELHFMDCDTKKDTLLQQEALRGHEAVILLPRLTDIRSTWLELRMKPEESGKSLVTIRISNPKLSNCVN